MVKQKGLKEILEENKELTAPMTYEEYNSFQNGFDDFDIEKAYESYRKVLEKENTAE